MSCGVSVPGSLSACVFSHTHPGEQCSHCRVCSLVHHRVVEYLWLLLYMTCCHWGFLAKIIKLGQIL